MKRVGLCQSPELRDCCFLCHYAPEDVVCGQGVELKSLLISDHQTTFTMEAY